MTVSKRQNLRSPRIRRGSLLRHFHCLEERVVPATFVVSSLADSGANTLRAAITSANAAAGPDPATCADIQRALNKETS